MEKGSVRRAASTRTWHLSLVVLFVGCLGAPVTSAAQPSIVPEANIHADQELPELDESSQIGEARAAFLRGADAAASGDWRSALSHFSVAHRLHPRAATLYNIGYCHAQLGELTRALSLTSIALDDEAFEPGRRMTSERRVHAEAQRVELLRRVMRVRILHQGAPLRVRVGGVPVVALSGATAEYVPDTDAPAQGVLPSGQAVLYLNPGRHEVEVVAAGSKLERVIEGAEGEQHTLDWPATPVRKANPVARSHDAVAVTPRPHARRADVPVDRDTYQLLGATALTVGGAAFAVAIVSGVVAANADDDLSRSCDGSSCPPTVRERLQTYETAATLTNGALAVGAVGALAGFGLLLFKPDAPSDAALRLTPAGVVLDGAF